MNNIQDILLFPVRDAEARKQFIIACLIVLASFIIPLLPLFVLTGYSVKIMRQVIDEQKSPSMPNWQEVDWAETFLDGVKLYGAQLVLMLPLFALMMTGFLFAFGGSIVMSLGLEQGTRSFAPLGGLVLVIGVGLIVLLSFLSLPYGVIISAAGPHVAVRRSFLAGFEIRAWWPVFRKAIGPFILSYAITMVISLVFVFVTQIAMMTLVLMCIVPFVMIPYSAYLTLLTNTLYAQAYLAGRDTLQAGTRDIITESA